MAIDTANEHCKTLYAHFGLAMYLAQVLEHGLVNALACTNLLPSRVGKPITREQWENDYDSFMAMHFQTTLGKMIRNLKKTIAVPDDLESGLTSALERRNFLAHHFFRERARNLVSHEGRERMIAEIEDAQALFTAADVKLSEVIKPIRERYGLTDEVMQRHLHEYLVTIYEDV